MTVNNKQRGFTLIEILIALVILGIVMSVALPGYQDSVRKSRRADAMRDLMELGARQERFYAANSSYTTTVDTAAGLDLGRTTSAEGWYNLSIAACGGGSIATCYVITASPTGAQLKDKGCLAMSLDNLGRRTSSGVLGNDCW